MLWFYIIISFVIVAVAIWHIWDDYNTPEMSKQRAAKLTLLFIALLPVAPFCLLAFCIYKLYKLLRWLWVAAFSDREKDESNQNTS
jgi:hypothetical protein